MSDKAETRLPISTLVTLINGADSLRTERSGRIVGYGTGPGLYNVIVDADGKQKEAVLGRIEQNVRVDNGTPIVGNERWLIVAATSSGDLTGAVGALTAQVEQLKAQLAQQDARQTEALANIAGKCFAAVRTIALSVNAAFGKTVEKALSTGAVQKLTNTTAKEEETVGAGK